MRYIPILLLLSACGPNWNYDYERCFVIHNSMIRAEARYHEDLCPNVDDVQEAWDHVQDLTPERIKGLTVTFPPDWPLVIAEDPIVEVEGFSNVGLKSAFIGNAPEEWHRMAILRHELLHHAIYRETDGEYSDPNHEDERWGLVN